MKRVFKYALLVLAVAVLAAPVTSVAKGMTAKTRPANARYLVIAPHTVEQCAKALDHAAAAGGLAKWDFGCMDGDHTGYLMVTAPNAEAALKNVPEDERATAKAIKMHHFTASELKSMHMHMAEAK